MTHTRRPATKPSISVVFPVWRGPNRKKLLLIGNLQILRIIDRKNTPNLIQGQLDLQHIDYIA
jgi:hypothetical protein